jgi:DNA-binding Lrp family transcriptional regulator
MDETYSDLKKQKKNLDELDRKLIDLLYIDSRMKYSEIAEKLGVSVGSVHNRIKILTDERQGVIKKFTVQLDPEKLDLDLTVVIEMQIEVAYLSEVNTELQKFSDIIALYNITGGTDILAIARFKNRRHMNEVLTSILKIKHITRTATHLALQILKEEWHSPSSEVINHPDVKIELEKTNLLNHNNSKHEIEVEK